MKWMQIQAWCQTDVGLKRERNEDSYLVDEALGLFLVADGMGGHRGGEIASSLAVQIVRDHIHDRTENARRPSARVLLSDAYREASHRIFDESHVESDDVLQGMGTTLVAAYRVGDVLYIANVGDSRAYLFSGANMWQLTEDHSLVNEQLRAGLIRQNDVAGFAAKNVITRSVGYEREVICDVIERQLQPQEMILICSDGLHGLVEDERLAQIFRDVAPPEIVSVCIEEAKRNGGDDNVTALLLRAT
jgi:protein phosphatase